MLFQNYGLFWQRSRVHWGVKGKGGAGHLKGIPAKEKTGCRVDFREQRGIYALYDDNFSLVYVGQSGYGNSRLFARLKNHQTDHLSERWSRFSWFGTLAQAKATRGAEDVGLEETDEDAIETDVKSVLNHAEALLIYAAEPPLNRRGGNFGNAGQFLQYRDDEQYGTWSLEDKVELIADDVDAIKDTMRID